LHDICRVTISFGSDKKATLPTASADFLSNSHDLWQKFLHEIFLNKMYATEYYSSEQIFFRGIEMPDIVLNC